MELSEKVRQKIEAGREYRTMSMTAREEGTEDGKMIVDGYATIFNRPYTLYEGRSYKIIEQIDPRAFDGCDTNDVIMLYDHEGRVFARNKNNTLWLSVDSVGLKIGAELSGTDLGRQVYAEIRGGYTDKMSFSFVVQEDKKEYTKDYDAGVEICTRTILKIRKVYDVSAVSIPANDLTTISARKFSDGVIGEFEAERLKRAHWIKQIKLRMTEV